MYIVLLETLHLFVFLTCSEGTGEGGYSLCLNSLSAMEMISLCLNAFLMGRLYQGIQDYVKQIQCKKKSLQVLEGLSHNKIKTICC